jgi:hypothetical protein
MFGIVPSRMEWVVEEKAALGGGQSLVGMSAGAALG